MKDFRHHGIFLMANLAVFLNASFVSFAQTPPAASGADQSKREIVSAIPDDASRRAAGKMKIAFDKNDPNVVYIEGNGERIKVDVSKQTIDSLPIASETAPVDPAPKVAADDDDEPTPYDFEEGEEPWDYRIVNVPTPKHIPKGSWNMMFTHRFSQTLRPIGDSARSLLGLDSFGIASFGVTHGVTDRLYLSAYRSPLCQRGACRTVEIGVGYNWIAQDRDSPVGFSTFASIEGNDNFTEEYTYNLQALVSARVTKRLYVFFSPAVHLNSNGQRRFNPRPNDYFPLATVANSFRVPAHTASFGLGASFLITPNVSVLFDIVPRVGFKLGSIDPIFDQNFRVTGFRSRSYPSMGIGIQRNVGKHSFALTFSNTQATTTSRYNSSNLTLSPKDLIIGFNLSRRF